MSQRYRFELLILLLIIALGVILRFCCLGANDLWFDEASAVLKAAESGGNIHVLLAQHHPIAFFEILLFYWGKIGGSEVMLRLPAVLCGSATIVVVFLLGRTFFGATTALISAFLFAISPFHIHYAQEIRMYAFTAFFGSLSLYFFARALLTARVTFWICCLLFGVATICLHPLAVFIPISQLVFFLLFAKEYRVLSKTWLLLGAIAACLAASWILLIRGGLNIRLLYWAPQPTVQSLFTTFKNFAVGYHAGKTVALCITPLFLFLALCGIVKGGADKKPAIFLSLCIALPLLLVFFISQLMSCYVDRYFIISSIPYYILVAKGASEFRLWLRTLMVGLIAVCAGLSLNNYYNNILPGTGTDHIGVTAKKEHKKAAEYVIQHYRAGDGILHTCENTVSPFVYYFSRNSFTLPDIDCNIVVNFSDSERRVVMRRYVEECKGARPISFASEDARFCQVEYEENMSLDRYKRVWLVFSDWNYELAVLPDAEGTLVKQQLDKDFVLQDRQRFSGISVYLYTRKDTRETAPIH